MSNSYEVSFPLWSDKGCVTDDVLRIIAGDGRAYYPSQYFEFEDVALTLGYDLNGLAGRLMFCANGKYGFADNDTGRVAIQPVWDWAETFEPFRPECIIVNCGCDAVELHTMLWQGPWTGKFGVIDREGNLMIPVIYDELRRVGPEEAPMFTARKDGNAGALNAYGQVIVPFEYICVSPLCNGWLCRKLDGTLMVMKDGVAFCDGADGLYEVRDRSEVRYIIARRKRSYTIYGADGDIISAHETLFRDAQRKVMSLCSEQVDFHWVRGGVPSIP